MDVLVSNLALLGYLPPLLLMAVALLAAINLLPSTHLTFQIGRLIGIGSFLILLGIGIVVFTSGPIVSPTIGVGEIGFVARFDALSVVMSWLVILLGTLLIQFSRNYLDGDPRQKVFFLRLYLTIGTVLLMVSSGNLWQLVLAWIGTSLALHELLVFYPERSRAIRAARKKFVVARIGDICLIIAAVLLASDFGTTDIGMIRAAAASALATGVIPTGAAIAAILIVITAALKSAMFPFHGWLLEVMETPTPVSALLHAGLLNAGIFLVVRFGELVFLSTPALILLIVIGGFTAIFASSAMITQSSVKVSLAYSSAAHMAFMLMLCGFGAHTVAIMHLIAHSCYKAHAFLSSGSIIEYVRNTGIQKLDKVPNPLQLLVNIVLAIAIFLAVATALGIDVTKRPAETAMITIFMIAVAYLIVKGTTGQAPLYVASRTIGMATLVTIAFFILEVVAEAIFGSAVAVYPPLDPTTFTMVIVSVIAFALVMILSVYLPILKDRPAWRTFYVHLKNGFYANTLFDRFIDTFRLAR
ncbi:MAG TPA: NADH-quinone oxidoreductase subunit L [Chloroflexus aurantiacus]|jgi:NAD(P)H-quinone oxidoreductase subunit 5|uniref:Probable inorganic carbon transporter subunit DabB n=1 Tax=Chloroflexus aurantiacus (strain ATCC 29366 / DSM 635 / J-10-fl) TaxID=324602 RepID=A9WCK4_CHLAA|nr:MULTISPECIES: proton-conducting transporter membrane subunit [Chloroflexus]ABY34995.1 NADH dehydrogenase (quinone) [Chloroflexus aurantiacus J-10-fl]RMG47420.1 MAG: NADH-quinone oxidoreductase subunit L [Chloroflexota bacterium]GIV92622.1 MAG: NADH dehydrogenase [Chloroflexus sp.]HBW68793.1 NADH-quinone oxidoreductase subunit L [Chloroflexus aurantiacus]